MRFKYIPKENDVVIDYINHMNPSGDLPKEIILLIYNYKISLDIGFEYDALFDNNDNRRERWEIEETSSSWWEYISIHKKKLSENFIREFKDKVRWQYISIHQNLSEDFIREFKYEVDWHRLSRCQKLSENLIREYKDKVDWKYISIYQILSMNFIREFQDKVAWAYILFNQKLSNKFRTEFKYKHICRNGEKTCSMWCRYLSTT